MATAKFNQQIGLTIPEKAKLLPLFDSRVYQYPTLDLAAECFLWRETDATRNSLTMAAHAFYSHKELHKAGYAQKHEMLHQKGINWNDYPAFFKRGTYVRRETYLKELTPAELARIPVNRRPTGPVQRTSVVEVDMPPLARVANVNDVLFRGAAPAERAEALTGDLVA
jgi:tRNA(His) 5'-end guanylyltransferase